MPTDLLQSVASNVWAVFLVVLFFGGSIFVHELGHFLAARRRGVHVERFSIGFGPAIWSRRGKDGVEYRLAIFPLGGYVLLPQLADLGAIEGESKTDVTKLPPPSYSTKMLVFVAGAAFNILFALLLATVLWAIGQPETSDMATTRIGYIAPKMEVEGAQVDSPAARAGLKAGDTVIAIDGHTVTDWSDVQSSIVLGAGRSKSGQREARFTIERDGSRQEVVVEPVISGEARRVGISPAYELIVRTVPPASLGAKIGLQLEDEILRIGSNPNKLIHIVELFSQLDATAAQAVPLVVRRGTQEVTLTVPPRPEAKMGNHLGVGIGPAFRTVHVSPLKQIGNVMKMTVRIFERLTNRNSDVRLKDMSGPLGIADILHTAAKVGIEAVLMIVILLNVNLALFNLLPIPVLDGGQMLFATITKLRGRSLPFNFIAATQSVFMVLLLAMVAYVTVAGDLSRKRKEWSDRAAETKAAEQQQQQAQPKK